MTTRFKLDRSSFITELFLSALYFINHLRAAKTTAKLLLLFIVIECFRHSQYGHYQLIRCIDFFLLGIIAVADYALSNYADMIFATLGALFYIPLYHPHFPKGNWNVINKWIIAILLMWILIDLLRCVYRISRHYKYFKRK